jgi:hypothetical protein
MIISNANIAYMVQNLILTAHKSTRARTYRFKCPKYGGAGCGF